jgi:hypothetical protein
MFLDKQNNRKDVELAYRKELQQEIQTRKSKDFSNNRNYEPEQDFALIKNV